jgi:4a-hydroxytetrahydrobiopterin dehydratase
MHCRPGAPRLTADGLRGHLVVLPGWTLSGDRLEKTFRFADYHRTIAFVNAVASIAHDEDHHPDLAVHYDRCGVAWSTHSAGGVTLNDCICAAKVDCRAA